MQHNAQTLRLAETTFTILRDLIHERIGIYYDAAKREILAEKVSPRAHELGFQSLLDYYYHLKYDPAAAAEWPRLMDALSVQETYFWRSVEQVHAFVDVLVPQLVAARSTVTLKVWCAACATGEEPLTIAMLLDMAGWFERLPIRILASDASPSAIARARTGVYGERSFRALPPEVRSRYFRPDGDRWRIDPGLHARVTWSVANLMDQQETAQLSQVPVIFCRNVFIYFSDEAMRRTVAMFWQHMLSPGYLFLASSESLLRITNQFELQDIADAFVYRKVLPGGDPPMVAPRSSAERSERTAP